MLELNVENNLNFFVSRTLKISQNFLTQFTGFISSSHNHSIKISSASSRNSNLYNSTNHFLTTKIYNIVKFYITTFCESYQTTMYHPTHRTIPNHITFHHFIPNQTTPTTYCPIFYYTNYITPAKYHTFIPTL